MEEDGTAGSTTIAHSSGRLCVNGLIILKIEVGVLYSTVHATFESNCWLRDSIEQVVVDIVDESGGSSMSITESWYKLFVTLNVTEKSVFPWIVLSVIV
jgi:hypothetical protein